MSEATDPVNVIYKIQREIKTQLSSVGFKVSSEFVDLGEDRSRYTFIRFEKQ